VATLNGMNHPYNIPSDLRSNLLKTLHTLLLCRKANRFDQKNFSASWKHVDNKTLIYCVLSLSELFRIRHIICLP
jgi:hypothetical protein